MATQEELILKQFSGARQKLAQQRKSAEQELQQGLNRRQAISGMSGGTALKAQTKARKQLEEGFSTAQADLEGQEAGQLRQAQSEAEAKEFARQEREASQAFGAGESQKAREFGTSEREASQAFGSEQAAQQRSFAQQERLAQQEFAAGEAALGRQFTSQERQAVQDFQEAQRLGAQDFASAESALGRQFTTQERQAIQAFQEGQADIQRQFQTEERLGAQDFGAEQAGRQRLFQSVEAEKERLQQAAQFETAFGLQQRTFDENKRQFDQQLQYQLSELAENKLTNFINAMTALDKQLGTDRTKYTNLIDRINELRNLQF